MKTLAAYIEYTLLTRRYCYVPGMGAFMLHDVDGRCTQQAAAYRLSAPRRSVSFTTLARHDDGGLATAVMETTGCDYATASDAVARQVAAVRESLASGEWWRVGSLGVMMTDDERRLLFQPMPTVAVDARSYGFGALHLRPWQAVEEEIAAAARRAESERAESDVVHISVRREWLRGVAVVLLVLCSFFMAPWPLPTGDGRADRASFVALDGLTAPVHINTLSPVTWDVAWEQDTVFAAAVEPVESLAADVPAATSEIEAPAPTLEQLAAQSANGKVYCIVVASCKSSSEAEHELRRLQRRGCDDVTILEREGRYRLYTRAFVAKADALDYLATLREEPAFADAWLLPVRPSSLNNKNSNIDDKLSRTATVWEQPNDLELSHLNQRTERDQG